MQIQINTDHNIDGREGLVTHVTGVVEHAMGRLRDHVTRVEVHLSDENSHKSGQNDKRCVMEARLEGRQPLVVTHHATNLHQAIDGAAEKLTRLVDGTIKRFQDQKSRASSLSPQDLPTPEER